MEEAQKKSTTQTSQNSSEDNQKNAKAEPKHSIALGFMTIEDDEPNDNINVQQKTEAEVKIETNIKAMSYDEMQIVETHEKKSSDRVGRLVEVLVMKPDTKQMAADIRNTAFGKLRGGVVSTDGESDCVVIFYRPQGASEYATQTQSRIPTLRKDGPCGGHYKCSIQAVLQSRLPEGDENCGKTIDDGDCYVVSDGAKESNKATLMQAFADMENKSLPSHQKRLMLFFEEDDVTRRRDGASRSGLTVDQTEHLFYVTAQTLKAPKRPRLNFTNMTTAGTVIGPISLPCDADDTVWKMPIAGKKKLYGPARVLPGGPMENKSQAEGAMKPKPRNDTTVEPVTFFGLKAETYKEILFQVGNLKNPRAIKCVIDLTPIDGTMGAVCLEHGIPYLAIALTEAHRQLLLKRLAITTFNAYRTPSSELYVPLLYRVLMTNEENADPKKKKDQVLDRGQGPKTPKKKDNEDDEAEPKKNSDTPSPASSKKEASSAKKKDADGNTKNARDRLLERLQGAQLSGNTDGDKGDDDGVGGNGE